MLAEVAAGVAGAGALTLAWAAGVERRWFALRRVELPVLRAGDAGTGAAGTAAAAADRALRLLHLSDLHLLPWQRDKIDWVRGLAGHEPDVVVATGDLLGHPEAIEPAVAALRALNADGRPALFVLGSNDFFAPSVRNPLRYLAGPSTLRPGKPRLETDRLVAGLVEGGWTLLDNTRLAVPTRAGVLDVAGLGDPHIRRDRPEQVGWDDDIPGAALRLGVVHAPYLRALDAFAVHDVDLVLAGHTHGGQVRVPGLGALVTNCDLPRRQARGLSRHTTADGRALWLHVSAGLGTSMYAPVRFCCRPEATLLTLTPRQTSP